MRDHQVVIAGGGPTGLTLAAELALGGIDVAVIERRATQDLPGSRSSGLHARTIELFDQRGIADRFLAQGKTGPAAAFNLSSLDISDLPTRHNYVLAIWQQETERILAEWVAELGATVYRGREVTGFRQGQVAVCIDLADGQTLEAEYLVGCDGSRSVVRKAAGIDFPGWVATIGWLIAEVSYEREPEWGLLEDRLGSHAIAPLGDGERARIVLTENGVVQGEPTIEDLRAALIERYGTDFGIRNPTWLSRFTDMTRQAAAYRRERVLLAGDAAHVHPPLGGQGLNIGVQDAFNLGWKLATVVHGQLPDTLLDTYYSERHPVAARILRNTMAQVALRRTDDRTKALAGMIGEFLEMDGPRCRVAAEIAGLSVRYDLGGGHPLVGSRMPDLDLITGAGAVRMYSFLHDAMPVLIGFSDASEFDPAPWEGRLHYVKAEALREMHLPVIGRVGAPDAVLVRPDGYVAWTGELEDPSLRDALKAWVRSLA